MIWGEKIETGQQGYINKGENIQRWPREINVTKHPTSSNRMGHGGAQTVKLIVKKKLCKSLAMDRNKKNTADN